MEKTGATVHARGMMCKAVAQSVILYVSDIWVVTGAMLKFLGVFQHQTARQITGMMTTCGAGGEWKYPPVVAAMEAAGLQPIMECVMRRHANIAEKVACCPIHELCVEAEQRPGTMRRMRLWNQDVLNEPEE